MNENEKRFFSIIFEFYNLIKKYKLKTKLKELSIITGIPQYQLREILYYGSIPDLVEKNKSKVEKDYYPLKDKIESFITLFESNGGYKRLSDSKFMKLLDKLKKEFRKEVSDLSDDYIIGKAKEILDKKYGASEYKTVFQLQNKVSEQYGIKVETASYISEYIEMIENYIESLSIELHYCCEDLENGIEMSTGEYDDNGEMIEVTVPLSEEDRIRYQQKAEQLRSQISCIEENVKNYRTSCGEETVQEALELQKAIEAKIKDVKLLFRFLRDKDICNFNRKQFQIDRLNLLTAAQQRAVLQVFYQFCLDKKGIVSPDHLQTGIMLAKLNVPDDSKLLKCLSQNDCGTKYQSSGNDNSAVFSLINDHKNVFFNHFYYIVSNHPRVSARHYGKGNLKRILEKFEQSSLSVQEQVLDFLEGDFHAANPDSAIKSYAKEHRLYNKTISEYMDILSNKLPLKGFEKYGFVQIYCIAYKICMESRGKYIFAYELVTDILSGIRANSFQWLCMMYTYSYFKKHREVDSIMQFIEKTIEKEQSIDIL